MKKIDLLKIKTTGRWCVDIELNGRTYWMHGEKAIVTSLWNYIHDAYVRLTGKQMLIDEDPESHWEVIEYRPEISKIWVRRMRL